MAAVRRVRLFGPDHRYPSTEVPRAYPDLCRHRVRAVLFFWSSKAKKRNGPDRRTIA